MAESTGRKRTSFAVETDEIPIPIEEESIIGDATLSRTKSSSDEYGSNLEEVFTEFNSNTQKRRETQAFIVSHLPSHRSVLQPLDVPRRRSLSRGHTFHGTLQSSLHTSDSVQLTTSPSYSSTLPTRLQSVRAKESLFKITEDLCAKDEVDYRSSSDADSSHAQLLKGHERRKSILDSVEQHTKSVAFRSRLKSVTAPIAHDM